MKRILALITVFSLALSLSGCCFPVTILEALTRPVQSVKEPLYRPTDATEDYYEPTEPDFFYEPTEAEPETTAPLYEGDPVGTVIDYSRTIVPQGGTTYLTHHYVKCPFIRIESADAQRINDEVHATCNEAVVTLENYAEEDYIYMVDYMVTNQNGILSIIMDYSISTHYGGLWSSYEAYFFNCHTGEELTFDQYLDELDLTLDQVYEAIEASDAVYTDNYIVKWAAMDDYQTYLLLESYDFMDEEALFTLEYSILD